MTYRRLIPIVEVCALLINVLCSPTPQYFKNNGTKEQNLLIPLKSNFELYLEKQEEQETFEKTMDRRIKEMYELKKELKEKEEKEKSKGQIRKFIVTYYCATFNSCGNTHFITKSGVPVQEGHIAVPTNIPLGSKIILEGREYIATDTGNPRYICELQDGTLRVDVFVGRWQGESDYQYEQRVISMGKKHIEGTLYIKE